MKTNDGHESLSQIAGRGLVRVGLVAVALALAASGFAQSNAAAVPKPADAKAAAALQAATNSPTASAARAPRGAGERIQVHGQWTIEVRNRDGSVARHVELENALVDDGPALLTALLSGTSVAGSWALTVNGAQGPCGSGLPCWVVMPGSAAAGVLGSETLGGGALGCTTTLGLLNPQPFCYATLGSSLTGAAALDFNYSSLTLSGQAYIANTTAVTTLNSLLATCGVQGLSTSSANACYTAGGNLYNFTEYDFGPAGSCGGSGQPLCAIPVEAGQVISVTVQFSFSSPGQSAVSSAARRRTMLQAPNPAKPPASTPVDQNQ